MAGKVYGAGSSPRVWGQVIIINFNTSTTRIIPTRMGTRRGDYMNEKPMRDHPHAYGDKIHHTGRFTATEGSSPRVWGQVLKQYLWECVFRIIPTRMGTSTRQGLTKSLRRDHPHAYGDKYVSRPVSRILRLSSPRVWGQVLDAWNIYKNDRIIPTRMGTSTWYIRDNGNKQDHPHAYGDKK